MDQHILDTERQKRLMAMGKMAASLAHEIRNPLGSMELFCSLLKKDLVAMPEQLELADQIHAGIRTLDQIIRNCLQFTRDIQPKLQPVEDPLTLIEQSLEYAKCKKAADQVHFSIEAVGSGALNIDAHLVKQVLSNIVINAMEAACERASILPENEQSPQVSICSSLDDSDWWDVSVADNGAGIPDELRMAIFDPFFSTKQDGTGLGLAIVHSIVTAHGGSISIESKCGEGSAVTVRLPRCGVEQGEIL